MPHTTLQSAQGRSSRFVERVLGYSDVDSTSLPTASTPRDADDADVGSQRGTHPEEEDPDFVPNSAPEPAVVPESGGRPLRKKGKTVTPAASVQPEAPDNLLEALNGASIEEEHRTVMSVVIQKVQLAKSGLTEACSSLLTGFEVRISIYVK